MFCIFISLILYENIVKGKNKKHIADILDNMQLTYAIKQNKNTSETPDS